MDPMERAIKGQDAALTLSGRTIENRRAGIGGSADMLLNTSINTAGTTQRDRVLLETLYAKFWAAAKIVDLKPDDAFAAGIVWPEDDEKTHEDLQNEMKRLDVLRKALAAVKAARIYGTALLVLAPKDGNFLKPLGDPNPPKKNKKPQNKFDLPEEPTMPIKAGEISHLLVVDRFRLEDYIVEANPANPMFGQTLVYRWTYNQPYGQMPMEGDIDQYAMSTSIDIHHSRCIRFDGVSPPTDDGWEVSGDDRWGQSVLVRALEDILQDKILCAAMGEVVKRACVPIIKIANFKQMLGRGKQMKQSEMSPEEYASMVNEQMTSSNLMFIDHADDVAKLELHTAGLLDIVMKQADRMAMIEGIPITRFTGQSASGLSATGEGDAKDWRITIEAYRLANVELQVRRLIDIVARNVGIMETPKWEWGMLGDTTEEEKALVAKTYAETVVALLTANAIDEEEARNMMNNSELFELDESWAPPPLEVQIAPTMPTKGDPKKPSRPVNMPKGSATTPTTNK